MGDDRKPGRRARTDDDAQALEEIRQLFARYRRIARHGVITERDERSQPRPLETAGRVRHSRDAPVP
jgi:hypothetical protein